MRYKVVPEPADERLLFAVRDAVPLVPASVEDCCTRVRDRTRVPSRDEAREWLTFCQALGLVVDTDRGYYRPRDQPDHEEVGVAFEEGVFGVRELLDALTAAEGALAPAAAFDAIRDEVPRWERDRYPDWQAEWRERVRRLLEWAVVFGRLERVDGGAYRTPD